MFLPENITTAPPVVPSKRPRARKACARCRSRKIRCDLADRQPCSNCLAHGGTCAVSTHLRPESLPSAWHGDGISPQPDGVEADRSNASTSGRSALPLAQSPASADVSPLPGLPPRRAHSVGEAWTGPTSGSESHESTSQWVPRSDERVWARMISTVSQGGSGGDDQAGPAEASSTQQSLKPRRKRVRFAGEPLAHSLLLHMDGHAEVSHSAATGNRPSELSHRQFRGGAAPRAVHPQGTAPWMHANCQAHLDLLAHLPPEDQFYLFHTKQVFCFPPRSVVDKLLTLFFESIYPLMPTVSRSNLQSLCRDLYRHTPSSPLLLHAFLFVACQFADLSLLRPAGFTSTWEAKHYFYQRAKLLYCHDCEVDTLRTLQALIFMSYWWADYSEEKDMRYWAGCAVSLALTMGMHKPVPESIAMHPSQNALWRRIFWSIFSREHTIAVALGLPFLIRMTDCDLPPLCEADFEEDGEGEGEGEGDELLECVSVANTTRSALPRQSRIHILAATKLIEVTMQAERLLVLSNEAHSHSHLETLKALDKTKHVVTEELFSMADLEEEGFLVDDVSTWTKHNVFPIFTLLFQERIVTLWYRRQERALAELQYGGNSEPLEGESFGVPQEDAYRPPDDIQMARLQARMSYFASADRAIRMVEKLLARDLVGYAPPHVNTSIFHVLLSLAEQIVTLPKGTAEQQSKKLDFHKGLEVVSVMKRYWASASWAYELFKKLAEDDFGALKLTIEKRKKDWGSSRMHSRLASHVATPAPYEQGNLSPPTLDFFYLDWYGDQALLESLELPVDWQV